MSFKTNHSNKEGKQLLGTMTGEYVQPIRVFYHLQNKTALKRVFSNLKCIEYDARNDRYVWLYQQEAKKIKFEKPYSSIPKKNHPIVIGSFFTQKNNEMYLETRSIERATEGILFFNKYIKKNIAEVTDVCIINKLFSVMQVATNNDSLFDNAEIIDPDKMIKQIGIMVKQGRSISSIMEEQRKKSLPIAERFPSHFYEDGIEHLKSALQSRQYVAMEHWKGNKDYTLGDYIATIVSRLPT